MHTNEILHSWLSKVLPKFHTQRLKALAVITDAAIVGGRLTVTHIGRSIGGQTKEKHNIKRADRLLSNRHLQDRAEQIYHSICQQILGSTKSPIIVVDWSAIDGKSNFSVLRAAAVVRGRALTLYEEIHDVQTKEKPETHVKFIHNLKKILPTSCKPIIVTDAGFRKPWFRAISSMGWDFVGRIRNTNRVKIAGNSMLSNSLYPQATNLPKLIGTAYLTSKSPIECSLVLYKKTSNKQPRTKTGGRNVRKNRKSALEPWLLATSLKEARAKEIVRIYSTRMQIEESFRDLKSFRYGLSFDHHRSYKKQRLVVLLLIGALSITFAWLMGKAAEIGKFHRQFQANSTKSKPVLSFVFIGIQICRKLPLIVSNKLFSSAQFALIKNVHELSYSH